MAKLNFSRLKELMGAKWCFQKLAEFQKLCANGILINDQLDSWLTNQYLMFKHEKQKGEPQYLYYGLGSNVPGRNSMKVAIFMDDN